jgi:hypothetical protein
MPDPVEVRFFGGPLNGTVRAMELHSRLYRVAVPDGPLMMLGRPQDYRVPTIMTISYEIDPIRINDAWRRAAFPDDMPPSQRKRLVTEFMDRAWLGRVNIS